MQNEIHSWLISEKDYSSGLQLYNQYCNNRNLGRILSVGGATVKNLSTLSYELEKVLQQLSLANVSVPDIVPDLPIIGKSKKNASCPAVSIEDVRKEQKSIYKILDALHASLPFRDLNERKRIAFEILDLDDRLRVIQNRIEHYEKTGIIISDPVENADELHQRMCTLRTYVCRYKKSLDETETPEDKIKFQKMLNEYQDELDEVNKKLSR